MAVYEGARPRPGFVGRGSAPRRSHVVERPQGLGHNVPGLRPVHASIPLDRRPAGDSIPRRRARERLRAGRRTGGLGLILGGIVVAFMLAFFSLAQTVRVTATDYEVDRLLSEQAQLQAMRQELLSDLNRLGREPAVRKQAIDLGLFPLAEPVVVRAR
jgi:hypothetical protein